MPRDLQPAAVADVSPVDGLSAKPEPSHRSTAPSALFAFNRAPTDAGPRTDVYVHGSRWLLQLRDTDGDETWHLFRVDLEAAGDRAVDLTPLPQGSRVFTVDPLLTSPGTVLVSMNQLPRHIDYFLIDIATGDTTARLPAGGPE